MAESWKTSLQCYSVLSTIAQVSRKMNLKFWMCRFFNFEPGVVPAAENYFELFKISYFTDVPTFTRDLKTFFSFQIEHLTLKFA